MAKALAGASDSVHLSQSPAVTATVGGTREGVILSDEDYRTLQQCLARDEEGVKDRRSGAVTIVQRFGGSVNLNVHYHAIVFDGVFATDGDTVRFHPCPPLDAADVDEVLATVTAYVGRLLAPTSP